MMYIPRFLRCCSILCILTLSAGFSLQAQQADPAVRANAEAQIQTLQAEKASRTAAQKKMDSHLVWAAKSGRKESLGNNLPKFRPQLKLKADGRVPVDIDATVTPELLDAIKAAGGTVVNSFPYLHSLRAILPVNAVEAIAGRSDVRFVKPAVEAHTSKDVTSPENDTAHRGAFVRSTFNRLDGGGKVDGSGVTVGVLSDSDNNSIAAVGSGDLPSDAQVLYDESGVAQNGSGTGEGTAMMEVVYDMAPGAKLAFATGANSEASMADNIRRLRSVLNCDIIIDDLTYDDETPFQVNAIGKAIADVCADGALYFSAATNSGGEDQNTSGTWEGDFTPSGTVDPQKGTLHDWGGGVTMNKVTAADGVRVTGSGNFGTSDSHALLYWAEPLGHAATDYDVYVMDSAGNMVDSSTNLQNGSQDPYERVATPLQPGYSIIVSKSNASAPNRFLHLETYRGVLQHNTQGSTRGHNSVGFSNSFFTVAATPSVTGSGAAYNPFTTANTVESFSSDGPRRVFFDANGNAFTSDLTHTGGTLLLKPDITAGDGVTTSNSFTGTDLNPFYGTSCATPSAAAITALIKSYDSTLTNDQVRTLLQNTALDIMSAGWDRDSGYGIIMPDRALASLSPKPSLSISNIQDAATLTALAQIAGTVADNSNTGTGIASVALSLSTSGSYWNGSYFQVAPCTVNATLPGDGSWSFSSLPDGFAIVPGTYRLTAVATDGIGNTTSIAISFTLAPPVPVVVITAPSGAFVKKFDSIEGTVSDSIANGVAQVDFTIYSDGLFWTGTSWTSTQTVLHALVEDDGTWHFPLDSTDPANTLPVTDQLYVISASATDGLGLVSEADPDNQTTVFFDNVPPTCGITNPPDGFVVTTNLPATAWLTGTASDDHPSQPGVTIYIKRLLDNAYWDGRNWVYNTMQGALTGVYADGASHAWAVSGTAPRLGPDYGHCLVNGTYDFIAIAQDAAGNSTQRDVTVTVDSQIDFGTAALNPPQNPAIDSSVISVNQDVFALPALPSGDLRYQNAARAKSAPGGGFIIANSLIVPGSGGAQPGDAIEKLDANGNLLWRRERRDTSVTSGTGVNAITTYYEDWSDGAPFVVSIGDTGNVLSFAGMDVDAAGNTFAAFNSERQENGITGINSGGGITYGLVYVYVGETIVVKFDSNGTLQGRWVLENGSAPPYNFFDTSLVQKIKAVGDGSCALLIENFSGGDPSSEFSSPVYPQSVVARLGSAHDYAQFFGYTYTSSFDVISNPENLASDSSGNIYITTLDAPLDPDTSYFTPQQHVIRKIDSSGNLVRTLSECTCDFPETWSDMQVDSTGAVYLPGNLSDGSNARFVLNKFDFSQPAGSELVWRRYGAPIPGLYDGLFMSFSPHGITLACTASEFGSNGTEEWSAARFGYDGAMLWCRTYLDESISAYYGMSIASLLTDSSDNVYLIGSGSQTLFGKIAGDGDLQFVKPVSTPGFAPNQDGPFLLLPNGSLGAFVSFTDANSYFSSRFVTVSNPANVVIPIAIDSSSPADQNAPVGSTVTFSVANTGSPATYQWRKSDGSGTPQPILGANSSSLTLPSVSSTDAGIYSVVLTGIANPANSVTSRFATLQVYTVVPLATALDDANLTFTTGGDAPWVGQTLFTHDGGSTAISGNLSFSQSDYIETQVVGPGILKFEWKDTDGFFDNYSVLMDGNNVADYLDSSSLWDAGYVEVPAGPHTIRWAYFPGSPADTAFLDEVSFGAEAPIVIPANQPVDQDAAVGDFVTFSANITGDAPAYQWFKGSTLLDGQTQPTYEIPSAGPGDVGGYSVVIGNLLGSSTSRTAQLTIIDPNAPDTAAPQLTALSVSPATIDVSASSAQIAIDAAITDNVTGFSHGIIGLSDPNSNTNYYSIGSSNRLSGNSLSGTYEKLITIPAGSVPGEWAVTYFSVTDHATVANAATYGPGFLSFPVGAAWTVDVVNDNADFVPPVLVSASSSQTAPLNVTGSGQTFTASLRLTDDKSGVNYGYATLTSPSGNQQVTAFAEFPVTGDPLDGTYTVSFTIPRFAEPGVWKLTAMAILDNAGNEADYSSDELAIPVAAVIQVSVVDTTPDLKAPVLASLSFTPQTVDVTSTNQVVTFTAHITDAGSGFTSGFAAFFSPSGNSQVSHNVSSSDRVSGSANDGSYQFTMNVPQGSEAGPWTLSFSLNDKTGNSVFYSNNGGQADTKFPAKTPVTLVVRSGSDSIHFGSQNYVCTQTDGKTLITVVRANSGSNKATVKYAAVSLGSASNDAVLGTDYLKASGVLTFKANETSKTFTVTVKNTKKLGVDKSLGLVLSSVVGSSLSFPTTATLTIDNSNRTLNVGVSQPGTLPGGSVTASFAGATVRQIGSAYTLTAKANPGFLFDHWTGPDLTDAQKTNPVLTFTLFGDESYQAVFVKNLFPGVAGTYDGVLLSSATSNATTGFVTITTTATPGFTGSITLGGVKYAISSAALNPFNNDGSLNLPLVRKSDNKAFTFSAQLDLTPVSNAGSGRITGKLLDGSSVVATFTARIEPATAPVPEAGAYTLSFPANLDGSNTVPPQTYGYSTLVVKASGDAALKGLMPDLAPLKQSPVVSQGVLPVYIPLYKGAGSLAGNLLFTSGSKTWSGTLFWIRPGAPVVSIPATGEPYTPPAKNFHVLSGLDTANPVGQASLILGSGSTRDITTTISISPAAANKVVASGGFKLSIIGSTGIFSGSFTAPGATVKSTISGIFMQKSNTGLGFVLESATTKYIEIIP